MKAQEVIKILGLTKSSYDGGYFKKTFRSEVNVSESTSLKIGSAIYYLITTDNFSRLHKCESDEMYHFYQGSPATLLVIDANKNFKEITLGSNIERGHYQQYLVRGGCWQSLKVEVGGEYSLFGVSVWPEFKTTDYVIENREKLISLFGDTQGKINLITKYSDQKDFLEVGLGSKI